MFLYGNVENTLGSFLYFSKLKMEVYMKECKIQIKKIRSQHRRTYVRVSGTLFMFGMVIDTCDAGLPKDEVGSLFRGILGNSKASKLAVSSSKEQETFSQSLTTKFALSSSYPCVACACHHTQASTHITHTYMHTHVHTDTHTQRNKILKNNAS